MQATTIIFISVVAVVVAIKYYDDKLDNLDIEPVLKDPKRLKAYTDCFLDKEPCSEIAQLIRNVVQEAIRTACERCTPKQKHNARRFYEEVSKQTPAVMAEMSQKYDPDFKFFKKFLAALADF